MKDLTNRPKMFRKKSFSNKNSAIFTGRYLCWSVFFHKFAEACKFIKKDTPTQVFSFEDCDIFKNTIFIKELLWLLLKVLENLLLDTILTARLCVCIIIKIKLLPAAKWLSHISYLVATHLILINLPWVSWDVVVKRPFWSYTVLTNLFVGSTRSEVFCKKVFLKKFAKFTRKHLYLSLSFNKAVGWS